MLLDNSFNVHLTVAQGEIIFNDEPCYGGFIKSADGANRVNYELNETLITSN
jgi:hypothetical protein